MCYDNNYIYTKIIPIYTVSRSLLFHCAWYASNDLGHLLARTRWTLRCPWQVVSIPCSKACNLGSGAWVRGGHRLPATRCFLWHGPNMVLLQKRLGNWSVLGMKIVSNGRDKEMWAAVLQEAVCQHLGGFALNYWPYSVNGNNGTRNLKVLLLQIWFPNTWIILGHFRYIDRHLYTIDMWSNTL